MRNLMRPQFPACGIASVAVRTAEMRAVGMARAIEVGVSVDPLMLLVTELAYLLVET